MPRSIIDSFCLCLQHHCIMCCSDASQQEFTQLELVPVCVKFMTGLCRTRYWSFTQWATRLGLCQSVWCCLGWTSSPAACLPTSQTPHLRQRLQSLPRRQLCCLLCQLQLAAQELRHLLLTWRVESLQSTGRLIRQPRPFSPRP